MRIVHILTDGPDPASDDIVKLQAAEHEVEVVDLSRPGVSYEDLIEKIFRSDKVVSW